MSSMNEFNPKYVLMVIVGLGCIVVVYSELKTKYP